MKLLPKTCLLLCLLSAFVFAQDTAAPATQKADLEPPPGAIKVACIGDSITYGQGIPNRENQSYPAQLSRLLGEKYFVRNYGVNGTTAVKNGNRPYVKRSIYPKVLAYKPDIAVIGLGTNDSKPVNWSYADQFVADYESIIADLKHANPAVKIFVNLPAPCFMPGETEIRDRVLVEEVIPKIKQIAQAAGATPIDLRTPLEGKKELFPDTIHPNAEGAGVIAKTVAAAIGGK